MSLSSPRPKKKTTDWSSVQGAVGFRWGRKWITK